MPRNRILGMSEGSPGFQLSIRGQHFPFLLAQQRLFLRLTGGFIIARLPEAFLIALSFRAPKTVRILAQGGPGRAPGHP